LRRLAVYQPEPVPLPANAGWFGWGGKSATPPPNPNPAEAQLISIPVEGDSGLIATLKNVFIPTPDPAQAPLDPAEVAPATTIESASSSTSSLTDGKKKPHGWKRDKGKMVDYINTLEISTKENIGSREAVVVLHGYAAALG
jgi:cardiolipin-specific phospholipase